MTSTSHPGDSEWNGVGFLASVDGPFDRFPPMRVLFLAHRIRASGRLHVQAAAGSVIIHLGRGLIHDVDGIPDLLRSLDPGLTSEHLQASMEMAMRQGFSPDETMEAATEGVCGIFASWIQAMGSIDFEPVSSPPSGSFPLPTDLVTMLNRSCRTAGSVRLANHILDEQGDHPIEIHLPGDSPESSWGLDAISSRLFRQASERTCLRELVADVAGGSPSRRQEVLHRIFLLVQLGILEPLLPSRGREPRREATVTAEVPRSQPAIPRREPTLPHVPTPPSRPESTVGAAARPPASNSPPPSTADIADDVDGRLQRLQSALAHLQTAHPFNRLELDESRKKPHDEEIDAAFREISKRYHPDRYTSAPPEVQELAKRCFALVNEAHDALARHDAQAEEWRRVECGRKGIPFVSGENYNQARISFRRGELQFRNKEYVIAEACLAEAVRRDPSQWEYAHLHVLAAFHAKQVTADDAVRLMESILADQPGPKSIIQSSIGLILKLSGASPERYLARFQRAVQLDPANRDALRELRLSEMRGTAPQPQKAGFFQRFKGS